MEKLTIETKKAIIKEFGGDEANTGSTEAQIAIFTHRIKHLTEHAKRNRKDFSNIRSLTRLVAKRRHLLSYLRTKTLNDTVQSLNNSVYDTKSLNHQFFTMNYQHFTQVMDLGDGRNVTLETGKLAKQADGSVVVRLGRYYGYGYGHPIKTPTMA